ncbi:zinc-binding dehydrogenase [Amycolatopsis nigrescens]|uniref:zinc-binding dehydrogenase n=1 Tax=Amycolatopsis nigrescens TaxID=381445 RepID=UPI0012F7A0BE|nr:zinc-binding dehydrogenase [Amycolatopsis nigrescens]
MRVVEATAFGAPEVLVATEAPDPVAGPGQVVVGASVVSVVFVHTQLRRGFSPGPELPVPPFVPTGAVAGLVYSVGEGVDSGWIGRRVVTGDGRYAERAVVAVEDLILVPEGLGLPEAAALMHDGSTALGLVDAADVRPGEWVLVEAAGGGLGSLLVQLARAAGARVIGAGRGARKLELVRELGAEAVVDYTEPDWTEQVMALTGGAGADVVFDGVGGEIGRAGFGVTARGGRFSVHGAAAGSLTEIHPETAARHGVTVLRVGQLANIGASVNFLATRALAEAAAGRFHPLLGQSFPLEMAADAHAAIEARAVTGKTLLLT